MQRIRSLYVALSDLGGRGVFTAAPITEGSLLEICPVIVSPPDEVPIIHSTHLHDYYFLWEDDERSAAIALGYGSLYNHSFSPNAYYISDYESSTLSFFALADIEAGEEITINYNGSPEIDDPLWFSVNQKRRIKPKKR